MNEIKELKTWQKFFGIILSIGIFFIIMICMPMHFMKQLSNEDFYYKIFSNINYEEMINNDDNQMGELQETIIDLIESNDIDKNKAINFLSNKKLNKLISKIISDLVKNSLYGDKIDIIDINEINNILDDNNINDSVVRETIISLIDDINNDIKNLDTNNSNQLLKRFFEFNYMSFMLISLVASYLILVLITNNLINPLKFIGAPCIISGSLLTIASFITHRILFFALTESNISNALFNSIRRFTYFRMYLISIGLIIIGFILTTAKTRIVKKRMLNNNNMIINN